MGGGVRNERPQTIEQTSKNEEAPGDDCFPSVSQVSFSCLLLCFWCVCRFFSLLSEIPWGERIGGGGRTRLPHVGCVCWGIGLVSLLHHYIPILLSFVGA